MDFPNNDKTYHNVFSLSKAKSFDLGRYAAGRSKPVRFDEPGIVRVFCEIHSHMSAFILVFAHRYFAVTDNEGRYRLDNVPPGHVHGEGLERAGARRAAAANGHDARRRRRRGRRLHGAMTTLSSLTNRIFFATAFLAVLCIGAAIAIVNVAVTRQAEDELRHGLDEAGALVAGYRSIRFEHFVNEARLIADLPKLKAAVDTNDPRDRLPDRRGLSEGAQGRFLHRHAAVDGCSSGFGASDVSDDELMAMPWIARGSSDREITGFWPVEHGILQVVSVPIGIDREIAGNLHVGVSLDALAAERFKALTNSEVAFAADGEVQAATLPESTWPALGELLRTPGHHAEERESMETSTSR